MVCEEIVNSGYICHNSAINLLYSHLLSISLKILYRSVILHIVFYGLKLGFHTEGKTLTEGVSE